MAILRRGEKLENRQLQHWQAEDEQLALESVAQKNFRKELKEKPSELKWYEEKFKEAIIMNNRASVYHRKGNKAAACKGKLIKYLNINF